MTNIKLLEEFRAFYFKNYPDDMEIQIEYFSVFGGLDLEIDTTKNIEFLIKEFILENFNTLEHNINQLTHENKDHQRLLRALAIGDRRIFSAFNRAGLNNGNGGGALNFLQQKGLIQIEYSREGKSKDRISHKVLFTYPFIRFWFYFVYPHIKEIKDKNYTNFFKDIKNKQNSYTSLVFEELSEILLNYNLRDAQILSSGSYWDAKMEIDILTLTDDGKIYVGECKWTNHQVNKSELHKLQDKCKKLGLIPTQVVLFSKRGFSKELMNKQSKKLALYSSGDFEMLLKRK
ncbi:MAG: DUF234 domain-containing protein [Epsilonproteobacteria bacterium]|nr:DUF234 domain-containing protein [Campylobacterota bacterium]